MVNQTVLVIDFGGQYNQLIARRVRESHVYAIIKPSTVTIEEVKRHKPIGIIFTGGPNSVNAEGAPMVDDAIFELGVPILGICYGCQLIARRFGGRVGEGPREYGKSTLIPKESKLFEGIPNSSTVWMSHTDYVEEVPAGFVINSITENCPVAGIENVEKKIYGVQFHPEVMHSEYGTEILKNFLYKICGATGEWTMSNFANDAVTKLKVKLEGKKVLCALSGGVDSAVAATLVSKACPDLICVFVDHGLLRKGEAEEVKKVFAEEQGLNLICVDASARFLKKLKGITDPEEKRKIIGKEFIKVFEKEAKKIGKVNYLVQGTIYPDVIESGKGQSATIKSHHNVGGLPDVIDFDEIVEPLRDLFKDEVRQVGFELGLPRSVVMRQPFPGPGLAIRIIGDVTPEKLEILRETDYIFREEIALAHLDDRIWQYFTVLTDLRSVGVMGDERTYDYTVAIRAVTSVDGMTADWAKIPYEVLEKISNRIVNDVRNVNRVVYDITSKPPSTIEWE